MSKFLLPRQRLLRRPQRALDGEPTAESAVTPNGHTAVISGALRVPETQFAEQGSFTSPSAPRDATNPSLIGI